MPNKFLPQLIVFVSSLFVTSSFAEVMQIEFTDTQNQVRAMSGNVTNINPTSPVNVLVSGGLDRRISFSVKSNDTTIFDEVSDLITINDLQEASDGTKFYGKSFVLPNLATGQYLVEQKLLDSMGEVKYSEQHQWQIDVTAPMITDHSVRGEWNRRMSDGTTLRGPHRFTGISVSLTEETSDIVRVTAHATLPDGTNTQPIDVEFDQSSALLLNHSALFTLNEAVYTVNFSAYDSASNIGTYSFRLAWDKSAIEGGRPVPVAIYDPNHPDSVERFEVNNVPLDDYIPYVSGMDIYSSTYHALFAIPLGNSYPDTPFGLNTGGWCDKNCITSNELVRDETHSFRTTQTDVFFNSNTKTKGFRIYDYSMNGTSSSVRLNPAATVEFAPVLRFANQRRVSDGRWVTNDRLNIENNTSYDRVRFGFDSRSYAQELYGHGISTTLVPAGATELELPYSASYSNKGKTWPGYYLRKADQHALLSDRRGISVGWDFNYPEIVSAIKVANTKHDFVALLRETDSFDGWGYNEWSISSTSAINAILPDNSKLPMRVSRFDRIDTHNFELQVSGLGLPEGQYTGIEVVAVDKYGNTSKQTLTAPEFTFVIDNTPPEIALTIDDIPYNNGQLVKGLESISISLTDDNNPTIKRISLSGGPTGTAVALAWNNQGQGSIGLEYPRILPSKSSIDALYELRVLATDEYGNESERVFQFDYIPNNLVELEIQTVLSSSDPLYDENDAPFIFLSSNVLRSDDGSIAVGEQQVLFMVAENADYPLQVEGQTIMPGETKFLTINLDKTDSRLAIPVYAQAQGVEGEARFVLEIYQLN
ncbi:Ig-like domain-containing protein [Enterovibrio norvegicus]|uniref:Ig-like domain-containing protein n=1 Tax=Enterovibrio norvegicus TaxID=188144 RepID=UPI00352E0FC2